MENFVSPKCAACDFGNGICLSNKVNTINNNPMKEKELEKDCLLPVQMGSTDHYILQDPGRIYHTKGKYYPYEMFSGGLLLLTISVVM